MLPSQCNAQMSWGGCERYSKREDVQHALHFRVDRGGGAQGIAPSIEEAT